MFVFFEVLDIVGCASGGAAVSAAGSLVWGVVGVARYIYCGGF